MAANSGVVPGDLIILINGAHTSMMRHKDAQQAILASGNNLSLGLSRSAAVVSNAANFYIKLDVAISLIT